MKPLDLLLLSAEYIENKEGVVITFSNGKMAKQKHLKVMAEEYKQCLSEQAYKALYNWGGK